MRVDGQKWIFGFFFLGRLLAVEVFELVVLWNGGVTLREYPD